MESRERRVEKREEKRRVEKRREEKGKLKVGERTYIKEGGGGGGGRGVQMSTNEYKRRINTTSPTVPKEAVRLVTLLV